MKKTMVCQVQDIQIDVDNYTLVLVFAFSYVMVQAMYICFRKILW